MLLREQSRAASAFSGIKFASRETLAEVRKSDEYRKARSSVDDFVAKVDERNASRVCSGPLAASK
jgi:hypothetical protein